MKYEELCEVIGAHEAYLLLKFHGGEGMYMAERSPRLSGLSPQAVAKLRAYAGGCHIYIPKLDAYHRKRRNAEINAAYDAGVSIKELARRYGLTVRQIYNILQ